VGCWGGGGGRCARADGGVGMGAAGGCVDATPNGRGGVDQGLAANGTGVTVSTLGRAANT
jgi:hypothetical protein